SRLTFQVKDNGGTANGGVDLDQSPNTLTFNVTAVNDAPTGSVAISGAARQGQTLTASNTLADADGLGAITYTWKTGATVLGTGASYVLQAADAGKTVTVTARYTDGGGTAESKTSAASPTVGAVINGTANADTLAGTAGNDILNGRGGNDTLNGGTGADAMTGGDGNDLYYVDNAGDVVSETNAAAAGGVDTVYSHLAAYTLGANVENLRILAAGAANGTGNALNNFIYAGAGANVLNGGTGTDTVSYAFATAGVTASLAVTTAQATGGSGSDTLLNFENLHGSGFNDTLAGNGAANTLAGGVGNDSLTGGLGKDTLNGGAGADIFKYATVADSGITAALRDVIQDFSAAQGDKIDLSALDANSGVAADQAFGVFAQGAAFSGTFAAQASLFFDQTARVLYGNNDADTAADFAIELVGVSSLTTAAFVL
ncbi:MAG: calcium-binding protein, partial [Candidatus Methylumidiphilus sp.]